MKKLYMLTIKFDEAVSNTIMYHSPWWQEGLNTWRARLVVASEEPPPFDADIEEIGSYVNENLQFFARFTIYSRGPIPMRMLKRVEDNRLAFKKALIRCQLENGLLDVRYALETFVGIQEKHVRLIATGEYEFRYESVIYVVSVFDTMDKIQHYPLDFL